MSEQPVAAISCRELAAGYGARLVLDAVDLSIPAANWTAVVGPNGCGKSTLLRTLAGLLPARRGEVRLLDRPLSTWPRRERARRLSWLAQGAPATDLTAAECVSLGRFAHTGWLASRAVADEAAIDKAMRSTGADAWAHRRLSTLSGGERQRVHIARALAVEADVLLLDEPTAHLDPPHQEDIARLLRSEARDRGVCVVSAIHDLSLALAADRVIVLSEAGVIGNGSVNDALNGDWLSKAFNTAIDIVMVGDTPLWRPRLAR
jgi:iron complex transport system ATP-binding protein